ncbi:MAG: diadenylate cyclase [Lachnospiraceae bacterium]|nr:diadenylate cyclase [Lachnospiraceae bacterium]
MEDNKKIILNKILDELKEYHITLIDLFQMVIEKDLTSKGIFEFWIANDHYIQELKSEKIEYIEDVENEMLVGETLQKHYSSKEDNVFVCKPIGGWLSENGTEIFHIYYAGKFVMNLKMNYLFLNILENTYCEWLSEEIARIFREKPSADRKVQLPRLKEMCNLLIGKANRNFEIYMKQFFSVDLNVINEISGTYYEGAECNAVLRFVIRKPLPKGALCIEFKKPLPVNMENRRNIRKRLQLIKKGQSLVAVKSSGGEWEIVGLLEENDMTDENIVKESIVVHIIRHMVWKMKIFDEPLVYYRCGKYLIDDETFILDIFKEKYKNIFGNSQDDLKISELVKAAMKQVHGTTLTILEERKAKSQAIALTRYSTGIRIEKKTLTVKDVESISSIDGAMLISSAGNCYGIGMIFDSKVSAAGDSSRGARFNSARKYMKYCKNKLKTKAIAVVVSEDKTVDVITTDDV